MLEFGRGGLTDGPNGVGPYLARGGPEDTHVCLVRVREGKSITGKEQECGPESPVSDTVVPVESGRSKDGRPPVFLFLPKGSGARQGSSFSLLGYLDRRSHPGPRTARWSTGSRGHRVTECVPLDHCHTDRGGDDPWYIVEALPTSPVSGLPTRNTHTPDLVLQRLCSPFYFVSFNLIPFSSFLSCPIPLTSKGNL